MKPVSSRCSMEPHAVAPAVMEGTPQSRTFPSMGTEFGVCGVPLGVGCQGGQVQVRCRQVQDTGVRARQVRPRWFFPSQKKQRCCHRAVRFLMIALPASFSAVVSRSLPGGEDARRCMRLRKNRAFTNRAALRVRAPHLAASPRRQKPVATSKAASASVHPPTLLPSLARWTPQLPRTSSHRHSFFRKPCRPADEWPAASTEAPCSWGSCPLGSGPRRSRNGPADAQQPDARCYYPRCREPSEPFIHPPAGSLRCACLGVQNKRMGKVQRGLTPRLRRHHDRNESPSGEGF